jgi:hypothetical protein
MPFSDAFSIANPFAINPELSNTPQAQAKRQAQARAQAPQNNVTPAQPTQDEYAGINALSTAKSSPLLETLASPKAETPQRQAMPNPQVLGAAPPVSTMPQQPQAIDMRTQYLNQLLSMLSQAQAAQQAQRMYPNRLSYVYS